MAEIVCDATTIPPQHVFSPSNLSAFVGNPPRELLIFSGIAEPEWDSKSELDSADLVVVLGPAVAGTFQYTSTVSLASISNTDSDFVFAADQSEVVNDVKDGKSVLALRVRIAVMGEVSVLSRLSYHVQVLTDFVKAKISGTIRWSDAAFGGPTEGALEGVVDTFLVVAGAFSIDPKGGGLGTAVWNPRASTATHSPPGLAGGFWAVPYTIDNVPLNEQEQVVPSLLGGITNPPSDPIFVPTPQFVTLTPAAPSVTGIDFELQQGSGVH